MRYNGLLYCKAHYDELIERELDMVFEAWREGGDPPDRFKYLLGRVSYEFDWPGVISNALTAAKIRDRTWRFAKTPTGCVFHITRHPGAFGDRYSGYRVVQTWEANLHLRTLELLGERDWGNGDPDP